MEETNATLSKQLKQLKEEQTKLDSSNTSLTTKLTEMEAAVYRNTMDVKEKEQALLTLSK